MCNTNYILTVNADACSTWDGMNANAKHIRGLGRGWIFANFMQMSFMDEPLMLGVFSAPPASCVQSLQLNTGASDDSQQTVSLVPCQMCEFDLNRIWNKSVLVQMKKRHWKCQSWQKMALVLVDPCSQSFCCTVPSWQEVMTSYFVLHKLQSRTI